MAKPRPRPRMRKMSKSQISRMQRNRREIANGNLPSERFLGQMSLDNGAEKLQRKIAKFKI